jgi:hypothetical protein
MFATLLMFVAAAPLPADPAPAAVPFVVRSGYFEKNTSGLSGPASYLVFADRAAFDAVFQQAPPLMNARAKPNPLPATGAFDSDVVAAVVRRGTSVFEYKVLSVTKLGDTVTVVYSADEKKGAGTATFASPLIVSVPKAAKVVFVEGKPVATVPVAPPAAK